MNLKLPRKNQRTWDQQGVRPKPSTCSLCPRYVKAAGYAQDKKTDAIKIACLKPMPTKDEILRGTMWAGAASWYWDRALFDKLAIKPHNVLFSSVLRCYSSSYPLIPERHKCELACRQYDTLIKTYNPNVFLITFSFFDVRKQPAFYRLLLADWQKAVWLVEQGYRPLVLAGLEPMNMVAPWFKVGGVKRWRGTWWEGKWE